MKIKNKKKTKNNNNLRESIHLKQVQLKSTSIFLSKSLQVASISNFVQPVQAYFESHIYMNYLFDVISLSIFTWKINFLISFINIINVSFELGKLI